MPKFEKFEWRKGPFTSESSTHFSELDVKVSCGTSQEKRPNECWCWDETYYINDANKVRAKYTGIVYNHNDT